MQAIIELEASGFLFIGDPHISSRTPGRRLDEDFCATVCDKLVQCFAIAAEKNLYPVILGDLFDDERESKPIMLTKTIKALSVATKRPLTIVGNHEKTQFYLTDDTALAALREARVIDTLERSGPRAIVTVGEQKVLLGGTPYGQEFPQDVRQIKEEFGCSFAFWLSHHDLAFQGAYPGALMIPEILGVDMLVNGHMHKTTPDVKVGDMVACNPGNITRMSVDCRDQKPAAWVWLPENGKKLSKIELIHQANVFRLDGYVFDEAESKVSHGEAKADLLIRESNFARLLKERATGDSKKTDDAQLLKEEMDALHLEMGSDDEFKAYMLAMLEEALRD